MTGETGSHQTGIERGNMSVRGIEILVLAALCRRQFNIRLGPQVAQISDREVQRHAHLARHDDEAHVPSQRRDDE